MSLVNTIRQCKNRNVNRSNVRNTLFHENFKHFDDGILILMDTVPVPNRKLARRLKKHKCSQTQK